MFIGELLSSKIGIQEFHEKLVLFYCQFQCNMVAIKVYILNLSEKKNHWLKFFQLNICYKECGALIIKALWSSLRMQRLKENIFNTTYKLLGFKKDYFMEQ